MPDVGRKATEETIEEAKNMLANTDMLFLTAGMVRAYKTLLRRIGC